MENVQHAADLREWYPGDQEAAPRAAAEHRQESPAHPGVPRPRPAEALEHAVAPCADEVAHAERLQELVDRVLGTGARTLRDPRALAVLGGVTDADRVYVASVLALQ